MKDLFGFTKLFETEKLLLFGCFPRYANMLPKFGNPQSQKYAEFFISEIENNVITIEIYMPEKNLFDQNAL